MPYVGKVRIKVGVLNEAVNPANVNVNGLMTNCIRNYSGIVFFPLYSQLALPADQPWLAPGSPRQLGTPP